MNDASHVVLQQKTKEYENLPAQILGIDGWVLRTIPADLRAQFLRGWLKLMYILHHPDRFDTPTEKASHQQYLQSANEAVDYLLSDAFAFEQAVDTVPTKRNFVVQLKTEIASKEKAAKHLFNQAQSAVRAQLDAQKTASVLREEKGELQEKIAQLQRSLLQTPFMAKRMEKYLSRDKSDDIPLALLQGRLELVGSWLRFENWPTVKHELNKLWPPALTSRIKDRIQSRMIGELGEPATIRTNFGNITRKMQGWSTKGKGESGQDNIVVTCALVGSISLEVLAEYVNNVLHHPDVPPAPELIAQVIHSLTRNDVTPWNHLRKYLRPVVSKKSILVFHGKKGRNSLTEFFWYP